MRARRGQFIAKRIYDQPWHIPGPQSTSHIVTLTPRHHPFLLSHCATKLRILFLHFFLKKK